MFPPSLVVFNDDETIPYNDPDKQNFIHAHLCQDSQIFSKRNKIK
jgi:hypothetical protein